MASAIQHASPKPETREQTLKKIEFYVPTLTDSELRLAAAFIRGLTKKS